MQEAVIASAAEIVAEGPRRVKVLDILDRFGWEYTVELNSHRWIDDHQTVIRSALRLEAEGKNRWLQVAPVEAPSFGEAAFLGKVPSAFSRLAASFVNADPKPPGVAKAWEAVEGVFSTWMAEYHHRIVETINAASVDARVRREIRHRFNQVVIHHLREQLRKTFEDPLKSVVDKIDYVPPAPPAADRPAPQFSRHGEMFWLNDVPRILNETWLCKPVGPRMSESDGISYQPGVKKLVTHASAWEVLEHWERAGLPSRRILALLVAAKRAELARG
jgi:hypothetical protein